MELEPEVPRTAVLTRDWKPARLGDKCEKVGSGITPTGGARVYKQSGRPFIRSQNIGWGRLLLDDVAYIDERTHQSFKGTEIQVSDVLLNITGASIGRSAVADKNVQGGNVNQHVCIIRPKKAEVDPNFLCYYLLSRSGQNQIGSFQAGGNREGLNFGQIKSFQLMLPSLIEQRSIATVLSDVDALIGKLEVFIGKKKSIRQVVVHELITGKRRLKGFNGKWQMSRLGDAVERIVGGGTPSRSNPDYWNNEIPWMTVKDFTTFHPNTTQESISKEGLKNSSANLIAKGTVITSTRMALGKAVIYNVDVCINQDLKAIFPKTELDSKFLYYWFHARSPQIESLGSGSTVMGISLTDLRKIEIMIPTLEEQHAITSVLADMDAEIGILESRLLKTIELKVGIMEELLMGG